MIIGIAGTLGAGKGETVWGTVARGRRYLSIRQLAEQKISYNLNSDCKQVFFYVTRVLLASNRTLVSKSKSPVPGYGFTMFMHNTSL